MIETSLVRHDILERFFLLQKEGRLAHAYLFTGPEHVGKNETAVAVAKFLNCENPVQGVACEKCAPCVKITSGSHLDVQIFEAVTKEECDEGFMRPQAGKDDEKQKNREIRIKQIQYLSTQVQTSPFEAKRKIFIIKNIENLNDEASNALLKTLEEPTANSFLILTSAAPERVFDTIKSRCQAVSFAGLSNSALANTLVADYHIDRSAAHFLAWFSEGNLGRARILKDNKIFERKNEIVSNFVFAQDSERYLDGLSKDKEKVKEALEVLFSWFRDLALLKQGASEAALIHADRAQDLERLQKEYTQTELEEALNEIVRASKLLSDNLNLKIALPLLKEKLWRKSSKYS